MKKDMPKPKSYDLIKYKKNHIEFIAIVLPPVDDEWNLIRNIYMIYHSDKGRYHIGDTGMLHTQDLNNPLLVEVIG